MSPTEGAASRAAPGRGPAPYCISAMVGLLVGGLLVCWMEPGRGSHNPAEGLHAAGTIRCHGPRPASRPCIEIREGDDFATGALAARAEVPLRPGESTEWTVLAALTRFYPKGAGRVGGWLVGASYSLRSKAGWQPTKLWVGVDAPGAERVTPAVRLADVDKQVAEFEVWYPE
jgi:hypothetical protein